MRIGNIFFMIRSRWVDFPEPAEIVAFVDKLLGDRPKHPHNSRSTAPQRTPFGYVDLLALVSMLSYMEIKNENIMFFMENNFVWMDIFPFQLLYEAYVPGILNELVSTTQHMKLKYHLLSSCFQFIQNTFNISSIQQLEWENIHPHKIFFQEQHYIFIIDFHVAIFLLGFVGAMIGKISCINRKKLQICRCMYLLLL